ncbi:putative disease resistance protein [Senna tora]|uniref:Putative disease resistance protein n=1 Tax=Senna tora TaxID=362788 RepID=A0A834X9P1_9FABA|nr:putative disease resistance protein [Senna tora]
MICAYPISGLIALYHLLHQYLFSLMENPQTPCERENKGITRQVEDISDDESHETRVEFQAYSSNSDEFDGLIWRKTILNSIMEALADPNTHIIGVYGSNYEIQEGLLPKVSKRVDRDNMFDVVLTVTVKKKPKVKKIQDEIASQLGFKFSEKSEGKRASELLDKIKKKQKILIIICNLRKGLDLGKVGIPFGVNHKGCKIVLTSTSEEDIILMGAVVVISRMIGLIAVWHLLRHYLVPSKDEKLSKEATETFEDNDNYFTHTGTLEASGAGSNSKAFDALQWRNPILDNVMEALIDPNTHLIGVYGSNEEITYGLLPKVLRRVHRDKVFDTVVTTMVTKKEDVKKIQEEIASQLGFIFNEKTKENRRSEVCDRIKNEQKILIIVCDLHKGIDLEKVGIPFGANHKGCKILVSSANEEKMGALLAIGRIIETKVEEQGKGIRLKRDKMYNDESSIRVRIRHTSYKESGRFNSCSFDTLEWRKPILNNVMEALADPTTHIMGVHGSNAETKDTLLQRVRRRIDRDNLFDVVLTVIITKRSDIKKIQDEIASQLGVVFSEKSGSRRAIELLQRIKKEPKVLIILSELCKRLDLGKVGIPFGAHHRGCKILLTSTSEDLVSNQMNVQKIFSV